MAFGMTDVKRVYDNGDTIPSYIYQTYRKVIDKKQIPRQILKGGQKIQLLPGVSFDVAAPLYKSAVKNENSRQNNNSIAGKLKYGNFTMFFTGDAEKEEEEAILKSGADIKSIVLKVGHHGSKSSTTKKFLDVVAPKEALISCGSGNSYGHPNKSVTGRLEKAGARIYRTDRDGTITIKTDGKTYQVIKEH